MLTVRPMTQEDLPKISNLWQEQMNFLAQTDRRLGAQPINTQVWSAGMLLLLTDERAVLLVAIDDDNEFVGYVTAWEFPAGLLAGTVGRVGIIGDLVIDMHRYRGGVARNLVFAIREEFSRRDVSHVLVFSLRHHVVGQAFWRSIGVKEWMDGFWLA